MGCDTAPIPVAVSVPAPKPKPVASTASVIASAKAAKAASVASPELPPPMKISAPLLPPPKVKPSDEDAPATAPSKSVSAVQTDSTPSPATTTPDIAGPARPGGVISASDLRNSLINLLTENPKGMTIKVIFLSLSVQYKVKLENSIPLYSKAVSFDSQCREYGGIIRKTGGEGKVPKQRIY